MNKAKLIQVLASAFADGIGSATGGFAACDGWEAHEYNSTLREQVSSIVNNAEKMGVEVTVDEVRAELDANGGWAVEGDYDGPTVGDY